jgi:imidazolonepropionase-like amidohydrolase
MQVTRCVIAAFFLAVSARGADEVIAVKAARIFDGQSNALLQNGVVVVEGDKIVDAGSNLPIPSSARVIDLLWMRTRI